MDEDLQGKSVDELIAEIKRLRNAIREHRDSTGHKLCWHHPALWSLLPEKIDPEIEVPQWPQFLEGCLQYRKSLDVQAPDAPRVRKACTGPSPSITTAIRPTTCSELLMANASLRGELPFGGSSKERRSRNTTFWFCDHAARPR